MTSDKILVIVHQKHSTPGRVGELLEARGYALDRCCPCLDHPLPADPCAYAAVVVFGGPMSANDHDCLAGIGHETEYTKRVLDCGVPYLGICLGRSEEHTSELQSLMRISYAVFCLNK